MHGEKLKKKNSYCTVLILLLNVQFHVLQTCYCVIMAGLHTTAHAFVCELLLVVVVVVVAAAVAVATVVAAAALLLLFLLLLRLLLLLFCCCFCCCCVCCCCNFLIIKLFFAVTQYNCVALYHVMYWRLGQYGHDTERRHAFVRQEYCVSRSLFERR